MAIHETDIEFAREGLRLFNVAVNIGGIVDADILGLTTVASLKALFVTKQATASEPNDILLRHAQSAIQAAADVGILTTTNITAADTVAGIRAIFTALISPSLDASTDTKTFAYSPRTGSV